MSADISGLSGLQTAAPLEWEHYPDAKEAPPLPRKGRYMVRTEQIAYGATKDGYLKAQVDPIILAGPNAGYTVRFTEVSAKTFERGGKPASRFGDFLRATLPGTRAQSNQELADAASMAQGIPYQIDGDWEAYCSGCRQTIAKGEDKFPLSPAGTPNEWVLCPNCKDENDPEQARRVRARFKVQRFLPVSA